MKYIEDMKIKELHLDTYINEPYMLLSRVIDKNVHHYNQDNRGILKNKNDDVIVNVPLEEIRNLVINEFSDSCYQILFDICDVQYKVLAVI